VVRIADGALNSATRSVTIDGNYLQPDMDPIKTPPYCVGESNGQIIGNRLTGTGNGPFTWQLISPSPVTTAPQASDTFLNLPAGNYTMRLTDACGGFRTLVATIPDALPSNLSFQTSPMVGMIGCDSAIVTLYMHADVRRFPLTFSFVTNAGTLTTSTPTRVDTSSWSNGYFTVDQILPGFSYGNLLQITVTDSCGSVFSSPTYYAKPFAFCTLLTPYFVDCDYKTAINFNLNNPGCDAFDRMFTFLQPPLIYTVTDQATNVVVDADTLSGDIGNNGYPLLSGFSTSTLTTNRSYNISIKDGCGRSVLTQIYVPATVTPPPKVSSKEIYQDGCVDSTAFAFVFVDNFKSQPKLILLSGPGRMGSTKPGYQYESSYNYPDTLDVMGFGAGYRFDISNLSVGTYRFKLIDTCGSEVYDSLVVLPTKVTDLNHHVTYKKGCLGRNELHYTINANNGYIRIRNLSTGVENVKFYQAVDITRKIRDSAMNLASGTYEITFVYAPYFGSGTPANSSLVPCQEIKSTVVIEGYQTPTIIANNYVQCKEDTYLEIIADSSKGVAPYEYEIISGPQTFPVQASKFFTITDPGTYTARIYDVCGNASTSQITVSRITTSPISSLPVSCNSTQLTYGHSAYSTYSWTSPDGTVFFGDTLNINPITAADTGVYTIGKITDINGCRDTAYTSYHLRLPNTYEQVATICPGSTVTIGTHTYSSSGIYTDTLTDVRQCDSIITLRLTVLPLKRDSIYRSICPGAEFLFNGKTYATAGIYSDTLATATCDSIATLVLSVGLKQDSINHTICANQPYDFNGRLLTLPGIYRDTLPTATCDSVVVLNLSVSPFKRDTLNSTICEGGQFDFNGRMISVPGTYTDTLSTTTCDSIVVLHLSVVAPSVQISASPQTVQAGEVVQLRATAALSYLWSGAGVNISDVAASNPLATLSASAWIYMQATSDPDGCLMQDSVFINVIDRSTFCAGAYIHIPSAFTPNGDQLNDVFRIRSEKIALKSFSVFNRWGELVFSTKDVMTGWNGRYKEGILPGTYVYCITYTDCMGETRIAKGTVDLLR
jgi:gliding motility-associated-like protein